jgi:hypothetical protein
VNVLHAELAPIDLFVSKAQLKRLEPTRLLLSRLEQKFIPNSSAMQDLIGPKKNVVKFLEYKI